MTSHYPIYMPVDSYKFSHHYQYPQGTEHVHCYIEARSNKKYDQVFFTGLDYYLKQIQWHFVQALISNGSESDPRFESAEDIKHAIKSHGFGNFDKKYDELREYVIKNKTLPVKIHALPENNVYKIGTPLITIENTDPKFYWIPSFLETLLLKVWYPCTVATKSLEVKNILKEYWSKTSDKDISGVDFQFHSFGDRGSTSIESAYIGGQAHLQLFKGSDNFMASFDLNSLPALCAYSIPAMEHSTVTSWGKEEEYVAYKNMLEQNKGNLIIAMVIDSYDCYSAVDYITSKLKDKIESDEYPMLVLRPDSGEPVEVLRNILEIMLDNGVKYTINSKGYLVFDKFRILWGDGINMSSIENTLDTFCNNTLSNINYPFSPRYNMKFSSENFAFGSGGWLMQDNNRDDLGFAYKCSAICINGEWKDVYKYPITDPGKISKKGRQTIEAMTQVY